MMLERIQFDTDATYLTVDCTGGFKSSLLLYLAAKDISEHGYPTIIIPLVTNRINGSGDSRWDRQVAQPAVLEQVAYIKGKFPNVEIREPLVINANFYWIRVLRDYNMIDVSEKALVRHVYDFVTHRFLFDEGAAREGVPGVISLNAQCTTLPEHAAPYDFEKVFHNSTVDAIGQGVRHTLEQGNVIVWQPFFNLNKQEIVNIANTLNIKDELKLLTQNCESLDVSCGVCYKCKENKWAKLND